MSTSPAQPRPPPPRVIDYFCVLSKPTRAARAIKTRRQRRRSVFDPDTESSSESSESSEEESEDDGAGVGVLSAGMDMMGQEMSKVASITHRYPTEDHEDLEFPAEVLDLFCFPSADPCGVRVAPHPIFSSFVLTDSSGARTYVSQLTYLAREDGASRYRAMCLISRLPMYSFHEAILIRIFGLLSIDSPSGITAGSGSGVATTDVAAAKSSAHHLPERLIRFLVEAVPVPGFEDVLSLAIGNHRYFYSLGSVQTLNMRAYRDPDTALTLPRIALPHVDDAVFGVLFRILSPDVVIKIVACMLQEQRILFHSAQTHRLTCACEAVCALIYPLTWSHVFIPVLPHDLLHYVEAPMTYLIGIDSSSLVSDEWDSISPSCMPSIIVDLDNGNLIRNHDNDGRGTRSAGPPPPPPGFSRKQNSEMVQEIYRLVPVSPAHGDSAHLHLRSQGRSQRTVAHYRSPFSGHRFSFAPQNDHGNEESMGSDGADASDNFHNHRPPSISLDEEDMHASGAADAASADNEDAKAAAVALRKELRVRRRQQGLKASVLAGSPHNRWVDEVRVLFLRAVMSLLISRSWDFRGHLQSTGQEGMSFTQKAFDSEAFVSTVSRALRPLVRKLVNTQMFAQFAVALVDTQAQSGINSPERPSHHRSGGEIRRSRSATANQMRGEGASDTNSGGDNDSIDNLLATGSLAPNLQGNFWHLLEAIAITAVSPVGGRPPPPSTPRTSTENFSEASIHGPHTPQISLKSQPPPPPHTPRGSVDFDPVIKPLPPPHSKRRSLTFSGPSDNANARPPFAPRTPATRSPQGPPPVNTCISSPEVLDPPPPPPRPPPPGPPPASTRSNRVKLSEPGVNPLPPPSGRAKERAKYKLTRKKSAQIAKRNNQPSLKQRLCRAARTNSGTPLVNAYDSGLENTNVSAHGVSILHVPDIAPVKLSKTESAQIEAHDCLWGLRRMRSPVASFYNVSAAEDATVLAQLKKLCDVPVTKDGRASKEPHPDPASADNASNASIKSSRKKTKLTRRSRRHSTMAALGTNDLSYLGVSEGRFAEIQKSIWTLVLPTTGRRCSFVAKRGRRGSMILAKGGAVPGDFGLGSSGPFGGRSKKTRVGSLDSLPEGDKEEDSSGNFKTPTGKNSGKTRGRMVIGGSGDAPHTASKFGKTPKYGKTPGASRSKAAAQNYPSRRLMLSSTRSLSKMTISPSTALHSPTAEDIHSDVSGGTSALSPSMNAIISTRRYEIAHKKYRSLVQERQELMARLEEIETGVMLKAAVCVLVRRWRMKQQARLQKVGMEVAGKARGLKPGAVKTARC